MAFKEGTNSKQNFHRFPIEFTNWTKTKSEIEAKRNKLISILFDYKTFLFSSIFSEIKTKIFFRLNDDDVLMSVSQPFQDSYSVLHNQFIPGQLKISKLFLLSDSLLLVKLNMHFIFFICRTKPFSQLYQALFVRDISFARN